VSSWRASVLAKRLAAVVWSIEWSGCLECYACVVYSFWELNRVELQTSGEQMPFENLGLSCQHAFNACHPPAREPDVGSMAALYSAAVCWLLHAMHSYA
jgi:hypothetical protein